MLPLTIPYFRTSINEDDIAAVIGVLRSGWLSNGLACRALEAASAALAGKQLGSAVSSGTAALHLALLALGVGAGDEVIVSSYVCAGLAHLIRYTGAIPVIVDVAEVDGNMSAESLRAALSLKTRAIIVPHMFGLMADIGAIKGMAGQVPVIEDCAMAHGATLAGRPAGSFGDLAVFSFYATKMVTGGEGGVVVTDSPATLAVLEDYREYDKKMDDKIRYNYKLSDLDAALAVSQLKRLPDFITRRQVLAAQYTAGFAGLPLSLPTVPADRHHTFYRYVVRAQSAELANQLRDFLKSQGVGCGYGVVGGLHRVLKSPGQFPHTERWLDRAVSLPIYPNLSDQEVATVINLIKGFYAKL